MWYRGYEIAESRGHGKAVAGTKRTVTIQVRQPHGLGYLLKAQIRYTVGDPASRARAIEKARARVDELGSLGEML